MLSQDPKDRIRGKCFLWLRKQYYNVTIENISSYDILSWKNNISVGICMIPDREAAKRFLKINWKRSLPAQYRVCFTFPGVLRNEDIPANWGIIECYHNEFIEKKLPKAFKEFDEKSELDMLGTLLTMANSNASYEDISSLVGVFKDCFESSKLNDNHTELIELIQTGKFHYLLRGDEIG